MPKELENLIFPIRDEKVIVLPKGKKAYMDIFIFWADGKHGDPENIFGSIADALFWDDKHLCGSFDYVDEKGDGHVIVRISF